MQRHLRATFPQPMVGSATLALACVTIGAFVPGAHIDTTGEIPFTSAAIALCLVALIAVSNRFPIHLRQRTKVTMASVLYYLVAILLPPIPAAMVAGIGTLAAGLLMPAGQRNLASDIASDVGRWVLLTLPAALVAHQGSTSDQHILALVVTAVLLMAGDFLTCALVLAPMSNEAPFAVIVATTREGYVVEAAQYLIGLLGALAALQTIGALVLLLLPIALVYLAFKNAKEMREDTRALLESMADTVDLRDPYTGGHSRRVAELVAGMLRHMRLEGPEVDLILAAARIHDIGKIGIPDAVLNKPGPLTVEERALMETHPEQGAQLLTRYKDFSRGMSIVLYHHESWNGTGYPHKLKGAQIPFGARVIAVADSFDAMTSDRPYRKGFTVAKAASILVEGRGAQWDSSIVDAFINGVVPTLLRHENKLQPSITWRAVVACEPEGGPQSQP